MENPTAHTQIVAAHFGKMEVESHTTINEDGGLLMNSESSTITLTLF
jgi:hypothetical protein